MPVYTVHAPVANGADLAATDKFVFVRDGFHFWGGDRERDLAAVAPAVAGADRLDRPDDRVQFGMAALGASRGTIFVVDVLIAILMGFEAASLRRWTLSRRKWRQVDIVVADDEEVCRTPFLRALDGPAARPDQ